MAELLPIRQAEETRRAIIDYVTTAMSLSDEASERALTQFLTAPGTGVTMGPYVRTRLPFTQQEACGPAALDTLPEWFRPYAHQDAAFTRLSSKPELGGQLDSAGMRIPQPTIVTTGTGSGKTESFLYPVLDHALRARRAGQRIGVKALILYPMNALANDQAGRLDRFLADPASPFHGLTAGLYTGDATAQAKASAFSTRMLTNREDIRSSPPDILLTNYKMLDQLLLRRADQPIWDASASCLRYLVLDEFHTYDGAQGTDVGMLLRRLRLALQQRSTSVHLVPVATSATLGGPEGLRAMVSFASTVFGTPIGEDAVVSEQRVSAAEFTASARATCERLRNEHGWGDAVLTTDAILTAARRHFSSPAVTEPADLTRAALTLLWTAPDDPEGAGTVGENADAAGARLEEAAERLGVSLADLFLGHPAVGAVIDATSRACALEDVATRAFPGVSTSPVAVGTHGESTVSPQLLAVQMVIAALSHLRARTSRQGGAWRNAFLTIDVHSWIREVSRVDRALTTSPQFVWSGRLSDRGAALPAYFCRSCGRSGWAALRSNDQDALDFDPKRIRRADADDSERFTPLLRDVSSGAEDLQEPGESTASLSLDVSTRVLITREEAETIAEDADVQEGIEPPIPVITHAGPAAGELARTKTCPACGQRDSIRPVGSRMATLLSVALTGLFGTPALDSGEKKALVFTDSVQDAAHRSSFVEARSFTLTKRSTIAAALQPEPQTVTEIAERMIQQATTPQERYRLLHPSIAHNPQIVPFWQEGVSAEKRRGAERYVRLRLQFDLGLEFGLTGQLGRTLLMTGAATAGISATDAELDRAAQRALARASDGTRNAVDQAQGMLLEDPSAPALGTQMRLRQWVRGVLERLRMRGAINHQWLDRLMVSGGRAYYLWGGRPNPFAMPAFPKGRAMPGIPASGPRIENSILEDLTSVRSWYADWTRRALGLPSASLATSAILPLMDALVDAELVKQHQGGKSGATCYTLNEDRVVAAGLQQDSAGSCLKCTHCDQLFLVAPTTAQPLESAPCMRIHCPGTLQSERIAPNYYQTLYRSDMQRVIAREHTALLSAPERLAYENAFKDSATTPGAPNVLVATPTLEMGIDIGDLSTVMLAGMPSTVASYVQRVGRAGRVTGNALMTTYVSARSAGEALTVQPLSTINGEVVAPGAYLGAQEILRRQFLAFLLDGIAQTQAIEPPRFGDPVLRSAEPGTLLGHVLDLVRRQGEQKVEEFLSAFTIGQNAWTQLPQESADQLRAWVLPPALPAQAEQPPAVEPGTPSTGPRRAADTLEQTIHAAVRAWRAESDDLRRRIRAIDHQLQELNGSQLPEQQETTAQLQSDRALLRGELLDIGDGDQGMTEQELSAEASRLRGAGDRMRAQRTKMERAHWISELERFGLLPNFTLVDDAVELSATVMWQNEDQEWKHTPHRYARTGMVALSEFAPGSHFYAEGLKLTIDSVDLGNDSSQLRHMAFCPSCGATAEFTDEPPQICPNNACERATAIADSGQHLSVVDLNKVFSTTRHSRAEISDNEEDRTRILFEDGISVDLTGADSRGCWNVEDSGFGITFYRGAHLTRLNLGSAKHAAAQIELSGQTRSVGGFLVCRECGHTDTNTATNEPRQHQAWCSLRKAEKGENISVVLARSITTEAVMISVPRSIRMQTSQVRLWTFAAAVLRGIAERFGGSVGLLSVDMVGEPGSPETTAILISDSIPGGTGYLAELSAPESMETILLEGLRAVQRCRCADEPDLLACPDCLTRYVPPIVRSEVSRADAETMLTKLLGIAEDGTRIPWTVTESKASPTGDFDSPLEDAFFYAFQEAVSALPGADVTEKIGGNSLKELSIFIGGRRFSLRAQEQIGPVRTDFVLTWDGADVAGIAIELDGRRFHASPSTNRVALDAQRRAYLSERGFLITSLTHADVVALENEQEPRAGRNDPPPMVNEDIVSVLSANGALTSTQIDYLYSTAIQRLMHIITTGSVRDHLAVARTMPMLMLKRERQGRLAPEKLTDHAVASTRRPTEAAEAGPQEPASPIITAADIDHLAVAAVADPSRPMQLTLALDDAADLIGTDSFDTAWRQWLQLANITQLPDSTLAGGRTTITTTSLHAERRPSPALHAGSANPLPADGPHPEPDALSAPWRRAVENAYDAQEQDVLLYAATMNLPVPQQGEEFFGLVVDVAWPEQRIALTGSDVDDEARAEFAEHGWRVDELTPAALRSLLESDEETP